MNSLRAFIRSILQSLGYDILVYDPALDPTHQLLLSLNKFNIDLIFDIGANTGQASQALRKAGYQGNIVSFEPLTVVHQALMLAAAKDDKWIVHPRCAIGDHDGEINVNVAGNSVSSSILPMLSAHESAAKGSAYIGVEKASIYPLDNIASHYMKDATSTFLKIDTQGFEWQVLDGATQTLPNVRGLICELSIVPLYEGQKLWQDMMARLHQSGFNLWAIQPGFTDPRDGKTLQMDAIFYRA